MYPFLSPMAAIGHCGGVVYPGWSSSGRGGVYPGVVSEAGPEAGPKAGPKAVATNP